MSASFTRRWTAVMLSQAIRLAHKEKWRRVEGNRNTGGIRPKDVRSDSP